MPDSDPRAPDGQQPRPRAELVSASDLYRIPLLGVAKLAFTLPAPALFRVARAKGTIVSLLSHRRGRVLTQLRRCFGDAKGEAELRRIARRYFQFVEVSSIVSIWPQLRSFNSAEACRIEGLEHLDAALERGKGAILLGFHLGYSRLITPVLRARGYPVLLVGASRERPRRKLTKPLGPKWPPRLPTKRSSRLEGLVRWRLLRLPLRVPDGDIEPGINVRPVLAALARNEVLFVMADGKRAGAQQYGTVRGIEIGLTPGLFSIGDARGATLLPAFVVDAGERVGGPFNLEILPPLTLASGAPASQGAEQFAAAVEQYVERYPHMLRWGTHRIERASPEDRNGPPA